MTERSDLNVGFRWVVVRDFHGAQGRKFLQVRSQNGNWHRVPTVLFEEHEDWSVDGYPKMTDWS